MYIHYNKKDFGSLLYISSLPWLEQILECFPPPPPPVTNRAAIDMTGCGDSSALEVVENSRDYVITCNNIGGTGRKVTWERGAGIAAGECPAVSDCQSIVSVIAVLSRPSYSPAR